MPVGHTGCAGKLHSGMANLNGKQVRKKVSVILNCKRAGRQSIIASDQNDGQRR